MSRSSNYIAQVHGQLQFLKRERLSSNLAVNRHIPGLDGLRAIAIGCVLVAHNFEFSTVGSLSTVAGRVGTAAVHLFFAISGYLITSRLAAEIATYHSTDALKAFYLRRIYRIIPPLIPYLALLIACGSMGILPVRPGEVFAAAFFASNYVQDKSWYTGHFWSLSAEEHFYLIWATMLALLGFRWSQLTVIAIIVLTIVSRPVLLSHSGLNASRLLEETHLQLDFFGYASLFALWMRFPKFRLMVGRLANHLTIVVVVALLGVTSIRVRSFDMRTFQALLFALIVLLLSVNPQLWATRVLENSVIAWVGKRSYGIYIWQQIVFVPVTASLSGLCVLLLLRTAIVLTVAGASYRFLEEPLMRKAHAWSKRILTRSEIDQPGKNALLTGP